MPSLARAAHSNPLAAHSRPNKDGEREPFFRINGERPDKCKCRQAASMTNLNLERRTSAPETLQLNHDTFIMPHGNMYELVEHVGTQVTSGFQVPINSTPQLQEGNNHEIRINIDPTTDAAHVLAADVPTTDEPALVNLARALWTVGLLTLTIDVGTALYKPARGVVFGHNRLAYYLTLGIIFVLGVAEAVTAYRISNTRDDTNMRLLSSFGRLVLCASIGPFVAIVAISGFTFIDG